MTSDERQAWYDDDLAAIIASISMSSLGPTNWHWRFEYSPIEIPEKESSARRGWLVWVSFDRIDYDTMLPGRGRSRDLILWAGTQKSGVVKTYYALVEQVVRHELFHAFRYQERELFDPHAPIDLLHSISGKAKSDAYNRFVKMEEPPMPNEAAFKAGEIA